MVEKPEVLTDAPTYPQQFLERFVFVVNKVAQGINGQIESITAAHGLTFSQYGLLLLLQIEGPQSQALLSRRTGVEPVSIGRIIDLFEARGYAQREPDPTDRRKHRVVLTESGSELLTHTLPDVRRVQADYLSVLTEQEQALLLSLHQRLLRV